MPTNKDVLLKGVKYLAASLPMFFLGPIVIYNANQNKTSDFYFLVLIFGIIFCLLAMFFMFKGIKIVMKSMFDK